MCLEEDTLSSNIYMNRNENIRNEKYNQKKKRVEFIYHLVTSLCIVVFFVIKILEGSLQFLGIDIEYSLGAKISMYIELG